jgi:hypothetical protein
LRKLVVQQQGKEECQEDDKLVVQQQGKEECQEDDKAWGCIGAGLCIMHSTCIQTLE